MCYLHEDQSGTKKKIAVVAFIDHGIGAGARHMIYSVLYFTTGRYLENNSYMIDIVIPTYQLLHDF
jgi:hypothetical protein